jgi:RHS repeat-associated protein
VRASKTVGAQTVPYIWDREMGLPLLVDDGDDAYLHAGGVLAGVDDAGVAEYHLADALGSVRGVTDGSGVVTGTAEYDVFGEVRSSSGVSSLFLYTGEQYDAETGFTFLRARYHNPAIGRFISADSVQPNAPGTQGYNVYAYVANNPTTWVDPSGHSILGAQAFLALIASDPSVIMTLFEDCPLVGMALCVLPAAVGALLCAFNYDCLVGALDWRDLINDLGSAAWGGSGGMDLGEA